MTLDEARKLLDDRGVELILAQFVDIHGVAKTKAVPVGHLEMIVTDGVGFAGFALWGYGMGPDGPDLMQRGDLDTLAAINWLPGYARIACSGYVNGAPYPYDSRGVLERVSAKVEADTGLTFFAGLEPEFFLLKPCLETGAMLPAVGGDMLDKPCYDYGSLSGVAEFLKTLVASVRAAGIDVYQIDHEDGNGQYEVNFTYDKAVRTADHYTLFKMATSTLAGRAGYLASFMPKPFANKTGSGMHLHVSLGSEDNPNVFAGESDALGLSEVAYQFLQGVLDHAAALAAVACPTVNSYKRLHAATTDSGATWAPIHLCYGDNNRTSAVRVCGGHIELRFPDSSANPYLMMAAVLAAGMDGIARGAMPGPPVNRNLYEMTAEEITSLGLESLPGSLEESLAALENDEVLIDAIGADLVAEFLTVKRAEVKRFRSAVTDWEREAYLTFF